ncbi:MAG TPA: GMC family oxidoreductase N-terminal domain-containing protein [Pseudonocardiaceae bacterium]|nr:GMC family oxidoreductase N-terminal domain-containing protein [Pseudonocardiaceae bacterium]
MGNHVDATDSGRYDYLIVGAGTSGSVVAAGLAERSGGTVAVFEAGRSDRRPEVKTPGRFGELFATEHDWNYVTADQRHLGGRRLVWPRGRILGGSASINAQMWVRGHRADYDEWGQQCPGWSFADVEPYFRRAERRQGSNHDGLYGTDGPQWVTDLRDQNPLTGAFLSACAESGLRELPELNTPDNTGFAPTVVTQRRGRRWSVVDGYLRPARRHTGLHVVTDAHVRRVLLAEQRAVGVEYQDGTGAVRRAMARREVVLCAGTIGSPHLLMLSGIGDPEQLAAAGVGAVHPLSGVGRNLRDHPSIGLYQATAEPVSLLHARTLPNLLRYHVLGRGPLSSNAGEAVAFIGSGPGLAAPDLELLWAPIPRSFRDVSDDDAHGITIDVILLRPDSHGRVALVDADPTVSPMVDPDYLRQESDTRRLVTGLRFAERLCATDALAARLAGPMSPYPGPVDDQAAEDYVRRHLLTLYHPIGTCRMGTDEEAVVDPTLRVRGIDGLRVVDASVLPVMPRGHTMAPAVMLAERAVDLITERARVPESA